MRIKELILLFLVFVAACAGFYLLSDDFLYKAAFSVFPFILFSIALSFTAKHSNQYLLPAVALLSSLGLINLLNIDEKYLKMQFNNLYVGATVSILILFLLRRSADFLRYRYIFGVLAIILFISPAIFGYEVFGAKLWIRIGPLNFQPAEIGRIFFYLFLAGYFAEHRILLEKESALDIRMRLAYLAPALIMTLFSLFSLIVVKDLGYSLLLLSTFLAALYIGTSRVLPVITSLAAFLGGSYLAYLRFSHVQNRINAWLHPWTDPYGKSYQILQALFAYSEGGNSGVGLGHGFPGLVPAAATDMVLPVFSETTGILGFTLAVSLVTFISFVLINEAIKARDEKLKLFLSLAGFGIFLQSFLVIAGTLLVLPLTGLTVPFFSYGGSSFVASMILLALSFHTSDRRKRWIVR